MSIRDVTTASMSDMHTGTMPRQQWHLVALIRSPYFV